MDCLRQVGARFGLGLAPGCSCLLSFSFQASGQDGCKAWICLWKVELSRLDGCQFEFGGGSRPLVFGLALASKCLCLLRVSLDLSSSFLRCPDWMPPILNKWTAEGLFRTALAEGPGAFKALARKALMQAPEEAPERPGRPLAGP